jgi:flagellar hook-associated protein 2
MGSLSGINLNSLLAALGGNSSSSGIDVNAAVSQAMVALAAPEQNWLNEQQALQTQATAIDQIQSDVSALQTALQGLGDPAGALTSMTATSSDTNVVTATAAAGTPTGSHIVIVNNIASTASAYSSVVATSSTPLPTGSFTIQVGTGTPTTIQIGSGVNTLDQLASSINTQKLGVTASVINDANGSRLSIVSNTSGSANGFTISAASGLTFTQASTGEDASLTVDGIPIDSASNTVTGAIAGLTLNLLGAVQGGQVTISVAPATDQIVQAIVAFVGAYNKVMGDVNTQFTVDGSNREGPLAGDSAVQILQSNLLGMGSYTTGTSDISTLADLGIKMSNDGTLTVDSATLNSAIQNNFPAVEAFMQGTSANGFVSYLNGQLNTLTDPVSGAFTVDLQSITNENKDLQNQIDNFQTYLNAQKILLTAEYSQADILLQQLPQQLAQINAELGNNTNTKNS